MLTDEPYTLTQAQVEALQALPPGLYLVCAECRLLQDAGTITYRNNAMYCERCA